jgi:putative ABC transport system permease protein
MRRRDRYGLALGALWQSKGRTLLTLAGVALGGGMLVVSLSLGYGLRTFVETGFRKDDRLCRITVMSAVRPAAVNEASIPPSEIEVRGPMSEERRQRLRRHLIERYRQDQPSEHISMTPERLDAIAALEHVDGITPEVYETAEITINGKARQITTRLLGPEHRKLEKRLAFGRLPTPGSAEILISESFLCDCGIVTDSAVEQFLGRQVQVVVGDPSGGTPYSLLELLGAGGAAAGLSAGELWILADLAERLPTALEKLDLPPEQTRLLKTLTDRSRAGRRPQGEPRQAGAFTVVGVHYADPTQERDGWGSDPGEGDLMLAAAAGRALLARLPRYAANGFSNAILTVDHEGNVRAVDAELHRMGFRTFSLAEWAERAMLEVTLIGAGMTVLSIMALVVAGLGITNTMVTSVLERTHDIGIMKAVGARNGDILGMFLIEGAVLGLLGGGLGLLGAWLFSLPAEGWIRTVMEQQSQQKVVGPIFRFPPWLLAGAPLFAVLVTTAAALLPARRAARIDPAVTLRTE